MSIFISDKKEKEINASRQNKKTKKYIFLRKTKKQFYSPFLWIGSNCLKILKSFRGESLSSTINKSPGISVTHPIGLRRVKS